MNRDVWYGQDKGLKCHILCPISLAFTNLYWDGGSQEIKYFDLTPSDVQENSHISSGPLLTLTQSFSGKKIGPLERDFMTKDICNSEP